MYKSIKFSSGYADGWFLIKFCHEEFAHITIADIFAMSTNIFSITFQLLFTWVELKTSDSEDWADVTKGGDEYVNMIGYEIVARHRINTCKFKVKGNEIISVKWRADIWADIAAKCTTLKLDTESVIYDSLCKYYTKKTDFSLC